MRILWVVLVFGRLAFAQKESLVLVQRKIYDDQHCITNETNKAVVWNTPIEAAYANVSVQYKGLQFMDVVWNKEYFFRRNFGPILDDRWESFRTVMSPGAKTTNLVFTKMLTASMYYDFQIPFSLRGTKEAHIYVCGDVNKEPFKSNCIWFLIGAWDGTKSAIRKCKSKEISPESRSPTGDCENNIDEVSRNPLEPNSYIHCVLQFSSTTRSISLSIWGEDKPFLHYTDTSLYFDIFNYNAVWVNSRNNNNAFWKFHDYTFVTSKSTDLTYLLSTNNTSKVCISMYAAVSNRCQLNMRLKSHTSSYSVPYQFNFIEGNQWQPINIAFDGLRDVYGLYTKMECANPYLALHQIAISNCDEVVKISSLQTNKDTTCQFLLDDSAAIEPQALTDPSKLDLSCPVETIGPYCVPCEKAGVCNYAKVCQYAGEKEICYCSDGFQGTFCEKTCRQGTYGQNCAQKCGMCTTCDYVNGKCSSGCFPNFKGNYCNESILPIIKEPPKLTAECYSECNFSVEPTNYDGQYQPDYYKVYYKSYEWIESGRFELDRKTFTLKNLAVSQNYSLKVVLYTNYNGFYNDVGVPILNLTTMCKDIRENEVTIDPSDRTTLIKIKDPSELCKYRFYFWLNKTNVKDIILLKSNVINNLQPYTLYQYEIRNGENIALSGSFTTKEAAPSEVRSVTYNGTSETITVRWLPPEFPYGIILFYNVVLEHKAYKSCRDNRNDSTLIKHVNVTNTEALLEGLRPFSKYKITIRAMNSLIGDEYVQIAETADKDELLQKAYVLSTNVSDKNVAVQLDVDCTLVYTPYNVIIDIKCGETIKYCPNSRSFRNGKALRISDLEPFAYYELRPHVDSTAYENTVDLDTIPFKTKPAAPNPIVGLTLFDLDNDWMAFKFLPPFPPTGEIEGYHIRICKWKTLKYYPQIYEGTINAAACQVWTWMMCIETPKILVNDGYYKIELRAKNKDVDTLSSASQYEGYLQYTAPGIPFNIEGVWDDNYNLTVSWQHPNATNGVLKTFLIYYDKDVYPYVVDKYNLTYNYTINIGETVDSDATTIVIKCKNKKYFSDTVTWTISNPPPRPRFNIAPSITAITNNTINIQISPVDDLKGKSTMYIIVVKDKEATDAKVSPKQAELIDEFLGIHVGKTAWIALVLYLNPEQTSPVLIGTGLSTYLEKIGEEIQNRVLPSNEKIDIYFIASNERNKLERWVSLRIPASTNPGGPAVVDSGANYWIYISLVFLIIPIIALAVYVKKRNMLHLKLPSLRTERPAQHQPLSNSIQIPETIPLKKTPDSSELGVDEPPTVPSAYSRVVNLSNFEQYVKESVSNGELARQHSLFPRGEQKPNDYGKVPQNKNKNRYQNLVAYNHSRVKLIKSPGDQFSDYINANFIKGLKSPRAYIATQGPKPNTVNDFWRMIWEENVSNIAMLANVFENGKKKTEQYWPNYNEELDFANIKVRHVSTETFADYEIRNFAMKSDGETRKIQQLHFNTWPDHGVPLYPQSLVPFARKILTFPHDSKPIVVHCSAGVGRTGTIILIDLALRMAAQMGYVDILNVLYHLREQRANMVDNIEQYKLAHLVILECLFAPDTAVRCNETFEASMRKIIEHDLDQQMSYIERSAWQENAITAPAEIKLKSHPDKDRVPLDIESYGLLYLPPYPSTDESSVYVNATTVDGFRSKKRFIATQNPLPNTIADFWRLVVDNEADIIVSLQDIDVTDATCCEFLPRKEQKVINANPIISVHFTSAEDHQTHEIVTASLHYKEEQRRIKIVVLREWRFGDECASNRNALLAVWQQMNNLSWNENKVIITCRDGFSASGFYLAMAFTLEKIKLEQVCDVCHAVRVIRRSRRQFVQSREQFIALYEIVFLYLSEFELYANFGK